MLELKCRISEKDQQNKGNKHKDAAKRNQRKWSCRKTTKKIDSHLDATPPVILRGSIL